MSASQAFANFGLFLLLAFIVPGSVYTFFIYIYFPELLQPFIQIDATATIGLVIILGLLISSVCYGIEIVLFERVYRARCVPTPHIGTMLAKTEAANKGNYYLTQVYGQYVMHFNIGVGILLIWIPFILINRFEIWQAFLDLVSSQPSSIILDPQYPIAQKINWSILYKFFGGISLAIVNILLSVVRFRETAVDAELQYPEHPVDDSNHPRNCNKKPQKGKIPCGTCDMTFRTYQERTEHYEKKHL